ncbi:MAG: Methionine biosynthesis protein MetW [Fluviibacter phosphoraccumulans EoVTN8]
MTTTPFRKSTRLDLADLRADLDAIADWIKPGERVLDLGCGDGLLLRRLMDEKQVVGYGIEKDPAGVLACVKAGVNVIQVNLERGLAGFEDGAFDHVIMSLSLQMIQNTVGLLNELLRVGHEAVVSFPNFGYCTHRKAILKGRMPVSESLPYQWFDTPNVRFFTIADFEVLCREQGIVILETIALDNGVRVTEDINFLADTAIYRLGRA